MIPLRVALASLICELAYRVAGRSSTAGHHLRYQISKAQAAFWSYVEGSAAMKNPPPGARGSVPVRSSASPPVPPAELTPTEPLLSTNIHCYSRVGCGGPDWCAVNGCIKKPAAPLDAGEL